MKKERKTSLHYNLAIPESMYEEFKKMAESYDVPIVRIIIETIRTGMRVYEAGQQDRLIIEENGKRTKILLKMF